MLEMSMRTVLFRLYWLSLVCNIFNNIIEGKAMADTLTYLTNYGYLTKQTDGLSQQAQDLSQSLKQFQKFAGLEETGILDNKTVKLMRTPRCGDKDPIDNSKRKRRYKLQGTVWKKKNLTYQIKNDPYNGPTSREHMPPDLVSKTIKAAFQKWSFASQLTFKEQKTGEADIIIKFIRGSHNDGYNFDGRGGSLAHAFYPYSNEGLAGDAHFDLDEKFSLTEPTSTNFIWVTTHEFGHSLGLQHSSVKEAIMYPWYVSGKLGDVNLQRDDILAIQQLYGKPESGKKREKKIVLPEPPRPECKHGFDATIHDKHNKRMYAFKGFEYYVLNKHGKSKGPKHVNEHWKGLKTKVVAAYTRNDGKTVLFSRYRYWMYSGTRLIEGEKFLYEYGLPSELRNMDAAVVFGGSGETYFFKGDKYWKYNELGRAIYPEYPRLISKYWRGLPDNLDSAMLTPQGETVFFKGAQFYKFNHMAFSVFPSYPKPIGPHWLGCKEDESGLNVHIQSGGNSALGLGASYIIVLITAVWIMAFNN